MAHGKVIVPNILVAHLDARAVTRRPAVRRRLVAHRHPAAHRGPIVHRNFTPHRIQTNFSFS
ncbi:MAG: hypothetical protein ACLTSX_06920 [Collinsella sp.]